MTGSRTLYLSYDGMTDPLGQSQVLPYLVGLSARGHRITLVSWEKPERAALMATIAGQCAAAGIEWRPQVYHARPRLLSTLLDIRRGWQLVDRLDREAPFDLIHLRSYIAADPALALAKRGRKFLFDMRGFWVDERIDREIWPADNPLYRLAIAKARRTERRLFAAADGLVSLTHAALAEIDRRGLDRPDEALCAVVPCCADLDLFAPRTAAERADARRELGIAPDAPLLVYLGSIGGAYRTREMFDFFRAWSADKPGARFLFLTLHDEASIRALGGAEGLGERLIVRAASREGVAALAGAADLGISFIEVSRSGIASSPVKMGELMALGVPVVANGGVGDVGRILGEGGGVLLPDLGTQAIGAAALEADRFLASPEGRPEAVRAVAKRWYDLQDGIARYDALYRALGETR